MRSTLITFLILLSSCSTYVNRVHKQLDKAYDKKQGQKLPQRTSYSPFYRRAPDKQNINDKRPFNSPKTYSRFSDNPEALPSNSRNYQPARKRYTASDLEDNNPNEESLWAGKGKENYLFTATNIKRPGDIVIVQVKKSLKDAISSELKRAFPKRRKPKKKDDTQKETADAEQPSTDEGKEGGEDKEEATGLDGKVYDKISSQIVKDINNEYFSINGVKEILFRKNKHMIRIQAIVPKKNITEDDNVPSDQLLDPQIYVLR